MIKIDDDVIVPREDRMTRPGKQPVEYAVKIDNVPLPSEQAKHKMDRGLVKTVERFSEAYLKVHGCVPTITYDKPWLRVSGLSHRVSRQRLLEMAKQLEYRAG